MSSRPSFPCRVTVQSDCRHVVHVTLEAHRPTWFADHVVRFEASRSVGAFEAQSRTTRRWWGGTSASSTVVLASGGKAVLHCDSPSALLWSCRTQSREPRGVVALGASIGSALPVRSRTKTVTRSFLIGRMFNGYRETERFI